MGLWMQVALIAIFVVTLSLVCPKAESLFHNGSYAEGCNLFQGQWAYNPSLEPLYDPVTCVFIDLSLNCLKNGRPDTEYLHYYWKPDKCKLPQFDAMNFLSKMRGKQIMFVGDEIGFSQWNSLMCTLHVAAPSSHFSIHANITVSYVDFKEFGVTIYYVNAYYLVDVVKEPSGGRILQLDSINKGEIWKGMDVLIFNSWLWWTKTGDSAGFDYIQYGSNIVKEMDTVVAFSRALRTWAGWVDNNVDPAKTKVFFLGASPTHYYRGPGWETHGDCTGETKPIEGPTTAKLPPDDAIKGVLGTMKKPVHLLDVSALSERRKDGHPSIYTASKTDCTLWCLPGLPDTWNQFLYAMLLP